MIKITIFLKKYPSLIAGEMNDDELVEPKHHGQLVDQVALIGRASSDLILEIDALENSLPAV